MDIEWVIYHLIHNDDENFTSIADLDIDLCRSDQDQWDRLLMGLSRNRTITSIELSRGYQSPVVTEDDLQRLFTALRCLPRLSKVKLDSFTTFDLEQTEPLFENNTTIEEVWIENAHCHHDDARNNNDDDDLDDDDLDEEEEDDGDEDFNQYERLIGYLATMSRHRLRQLRIEIPAKISHDAPLAILLSGSSKLETLVLETTSVISSTLAATFSIPRVARTESDRHQNFTAMMFALRSNIVLKTLDMDFLISFSDFNEVATMLQHNNSLTDLRVRLDSSTVIILNENNVQKYHHHFTESIQCFFEALKTNTNSALKNFTQYYFDDLGFIHLISVTNRINMKIAQKLAEMGLEMLECNLSLESFSFFLFDVNNCFLRDEKQMFLQLNQRGRRSVQHPDIRETVSKSAWIDQLAKHSNDDLNGLYYYISTNPSICRLIREEDTTCSTSNSNIPTTSTVIDKSETERGKVLANGDNPEDLSGLLSSNTRSNNDIAVDQVVVPQTKRQRFDNVTKNCSK